MKTATAQKHYVKNPFLVSIKAANMHLLCKKQQKITIFNILFLLTSQTCNFYLYNDCNKNKIESLLKGESLHQS